MKNKPKDKPQFDARKLRRVEEYASVSKDGRAVTLDFHAETGLEDSLRAVVIVCSASRTPLLRYKIRSPTVGYRYTTMDLEFARS